SINNTRPARWLACDNGSELLRVPLRCATVFAFEFLDWRRLRKDVRCRSVDKFRANYPNCVDYETTCLYYFPQLVDFNTSRQGCEHEASVGLARCRPSRICSRSFSKEFGSRCREGLYTRGLNCIF